MSLVSNLILPLIVVIIILFGVKNKVDVYDTFVDGAKESFDMVLKLFPSLLGMILGINIFIKSGFLDFVLSFFKPLFTFISVPLDIVPLILMRPISGSSGIALLNNIFGVYGADHLISRMASIIQGSTDTTLYILTLYFGSVGVKKIKYALHVGLLADFIGIVSAIIIAKVMF